MKILTAVFILMVSLAGCAQSPVTTDYDPMIDFSQFNSYGWASDGSAAFGQSDDGLMDRRIQRAVADEFAMRGLVYNAENPDLLIGYQLKRETKVQYYHYPLISHYHYAHRHTPLFYDDRVVVHQYDEELLILDVFESDHSLIWRGGYRSAAKNRPDPTTRELYVRDRVAEILQTFPR